MDAKSELGSRSARMRVAALMATCLLALLAGCGNCSATAGGGVLPAGRIAFAGHGYSEDVDVIDLDSMTIVATITGAGGYRMVLSPDGDTLYSTGGDDLVYVSDARTFTLTSSFDPSAGFAGITSSELEAIAINPAGTRVYVFDESGDTAIFVLDTASNTVIAAQGLALDEPENAVVSPDGAFVYVVDNSVIAKVSTASLSIVDTVAVGSDAHGIALNGSGTHVYAKGTSDGIDVFDTATLGFVTNIPTGSGSFAIGYYLDNRPGSSRLYGVDERFTLSVMNSGANTLIQDVTLSLTDARGVFAAPGGSPVVVTSGDGLVKIDAITFAELGSMPGRYQGLVIR